MMVVTVGVGSDNGDGGIGDVSMVAMVVLLVDDGIVTGRGCIGNGCGGEKELMAYESLYFPSAWVSISSNLLDFFGIVT